MLDSTLSVARSYFQTALQTRADGKKVVLVIGGKTGSGGNTVVYPVIDVFSVETGARSTTELATGRFLSAVVSVPLADSDANDVWVLGGFGAGLACLDSVECIRAANGAVIALSDMNSPRAEFAAAWLPDSETVIAVGGSSDALAALLTRPRSPQRWLALGFGHPDQDNRSGRPLPCYRRRRRPGATSRLWRPRRHLPIPEGD